MTGHWTLGIDCGYAAGAICILDAHDNAEFIDISKCPLDIAKEWLQKFFSSSNIDFALIEKVGAMPTQGIVSALNFGKGIGWCQMLLAMSAVPHEEITPQRWQEVVVPKRGVLAIPKDGSFTEKAKLRAQNKRILKEDIFNWAKKRFPKAELRSFSKDSNRADALGIAYYARLKFNQQLTANS